MPGPRYATTPLHKFMLRLPPDSIPTTQYKKGFESYHVRLVQTLTLGGQSKRSPINHTFTFGYTGTGYIQWQKVSLVHVSLTINLKEIPAASTLHDLVRYLFFTSDTRSLDMTTL